MTIFEIIQKYVEKIAAEHNDENISITIHLSNFFYETIESVAQIILNCESRKVDYSEIHCNNVVCQIKSSDRTSKCIEKEIYAIIKNANPIEQSNQ